MERIFEIYDYDYDGKYTKLEGRAILYFHKNDNVYIKDKDKEEYKKVDINRIEFFRKEIDDICPVCTACIFIRCDYEQFKQCDMHLYRSIDSKI